MPDFADIIPALYQNVSSGFLETLIQARREELFTGLMRLSHMSGENFLFSFLNGTQQKLYRCHDGAVHIVPRQTWPEALGRDGATVGYLSLPVEAMRFLRILHEVPVDHTDELMLSSEELTTAVGKWAV